MEISQFIVNQFYENSYILWDCVGGDAIVIDPGMADERERNAIDGFIEKKNLTLKKVILTHQHIDHILSAEYLANKYGVGIYASAKDNSLGEVLPQQALLFGLHCQCSPLIGVLPLVEGDVIQLGNETIKVIEVPGHSQGGLAFYVPSMSVVFAGDSLFERSIGRTDLVGGDFNQLLDSIKTKLYTLPEDTVVYCGHGDATTIGDERRYNPYCRS